MGCFGMFKVNSLGFMLFLRLFNVKSLEFRHVGSLCAALTHLIK
jgi:hypothetical protein